MKNRDSLLWKSNHPYGFTISPIPDLHATVAMKNTRHVKQYVAQVSFQTLYVRQEHFLTARDAQQWCENWLLHFLEFQEMKQQAA